LDVRAAAGTIAEGGADESAIDHEYAREMFYPAGRHVDGEFVIPASATQQSSRLS